MSDPTDYHRKLAEAIVRSSGRYEPGVDRIAAVLASEQVVDPEEFMQAQRYIGRCHEGINERDAEVERLKAAPINTAAQAKAIDASITVAFYNGIEKAAKISEKYIINPEIIRPRPARMITDGVASAIRAEIKQ